MAPDLTGRHFLKELDFTAEEFRGLVDLAARLKAARRAGTEVRMLRGRNIALVFEKTSTRTRCAFEVAAAHQGASTTHLDPSGSQIGHKESVRDTARVLGRMFDAVEYRGAGQETVEELARYAGVPVYNGLTDDWHPTQMLADVLTVTEHTDKPLERVAFAYLGDARNNMGNSYLVTGALLGMDLRVAAPARTGRPRTSSSTPASSRRRAAPASRSPRTSRRGSRAPTSSPPTCGCRWASRRRCGTSGSPPSARTP